MVAPFQQQNEREKSSMFFIKLTLFNLNDSEIMFLIFWVLKCLFFYIVMLIADSTLDLPVFVLCP